MKKKKETYQVDMGQTIKYLILDISSPFKRAEKKFDMYQSINNSKLNVHY